MKCWKSADFFGLLFATVAPPTGLLKHGRMNAERSEANIQMLQFTNGKSSGVLKKENIESIERHRDTFRALVKQGRGVKGGG